MFSFSAGRTDHITVNRQRCCTSQMLRRPMTSFATCITKLSWETSCQPSLSIRITQRKTGPPINTGGRRRTRSSLTSTLRSLCTTSRVIRRRSATKPSTARSLSRAGAISTRKIKRCLLKSCGKFTRTTSSAQIYRKTKDTYCLKDGATHRERGSGSAWSRRLA